MNAWETELDRRAEEFARHDWIWSEKTFLEHKQVRPKFPWFGLCVFVWAMLIGAFLAIVARML